MDSFDINNSNLMNMSNLGFLFVQLRMDVHIKYWASLELDQQVKALAEKRTYINTYTHTYIELFVKIAPDPVAINT